MTAEPIKYVVLCDCDDQPGAFIVGWIDDERAVGGPVVVRSNTAFIATSRKDGKRTTYSIRCRACGKNALLNSEAGAAAVCDVLTPQLGGLTVSDVPDCDDPSNIEPRHEIPLGVLCRILSQLSE